MEEFKCYANDCRCTGTVRSVIGPGRLREYMPGVHLPIPDDFPVMTCDTCGETYSRLEDSEKLDELQRPDKSRLGN